MAGLVARLEKFEAEQRRSEGERRKVRAELEKTVVGQRMIDQRMGRMEDTMGEIASLVKSLAASTGSSASAADHRRDAPARDKGRSSALRPGKEKASSQLDLRGMRASLGGPPSGEFTKG